MTGLERLNFTNGRVLDAADLSLEQCYHIAVRRLLNRGLFTPGVVNGLEVTKKDTRTVTVAPGLALDPAGRELFVASAVDVAVPNQPPVNQDRTGYFLALRYEEESIPGPAHPCDANGAAPDPARIRETPKLEWTEDWPSHQACGSATGRPIDCAIVIALVTLDLSCQIAGIETAFRQYAYPSHLSQVQSLALEGEKDIDSANPKTLYFHIRGGTPSSVLLYLWGEQFSSLYYSELAAHTHALTALALESRAVDLGSHTHDLGNHTHGIAHTHTATLIGTASSGGHRHALKLQQPSGDKIFTTSVGANFDKLVAQPGRVPFMPDADGTHTHSLSVAGTSNGASRNTSDGPSTNITAVPSTNSSAQTHTHGLVSATLTTVGQGPAVRQGAPYTWLTDMRVELDGIDITQQLLTRFLSGWGQFGNGQPGHALNTVGGTGPLNLLALGQRIDQGPHRLRLSVAQGGGKVLYNLYVS